MKLNRSHDQESAAARYYALVLRLYPKAHREAYGALMLRAFKDSYQDEIASKGRVGLRFWLDVIEDEVKSIVREGISAMINRLPLRTYRYGLLLGVVLVAVIVWGIVISPTFESDDEYGAQYLLIAGFFLLYFALSGFLESRRDSSIAHGARVGAITALITIAVITVTYFVVDNVFIDIVSKQPDKIYGFQHSNFATMRDYINDGFLRGLLIVPLVFGVVGAVCGAIGAYVRKLLTRPTAAIPSH